MHKSHYKLHGYCYLCNLFGHKALECRTSKQHMNDLKRPYHRQYFSYTLNGYCYSCNKFGHRALNCRRKENNFLNFRNQNTFRPLIDLDILCSNCNNFGHAAHQCRTTFPTNSAKKENRSNKKVWKRKEKSQFVQIDLHAQNKKDRWYVDMKCSRHMTGDKWKFISFEPINDGTVKFGDSSKQRIKGKGTLSLDHERTKTKDVLYVKGLKENLLSVSQLCDQGHNVMFHPKGCEIKKDGELIENANRTANNLYIL